MKTIAGLLLIASLLLCQATFYPNFKECKNDTLTYLECGGGTSCDFITYYNQYCGSFSCYGYTTCACTDDEGIINADIVPGTITPVLAPIWDVNADCGGTCASATLPGGGTVWVCPRCVASGTAMPVSEWGWVCSSYTIK